MRNCAKDIKLTTLNNFCSKKRKLLVSPKKDLNIERMNNATEGK